MAARKTPTYRQPSRGDLIDRGVLEAQAPIVNPSSGRSYQTLGIYEARKSIRRTSSFVSPRDAPLQVPNAVDVSAQTPSRSFVPTRPASTMRSGWHDARPP